MTGGDRVGDIILTGNEKDFHRSDGFFYEEENA